MLQRVARLSWFLNQDLQPGYRFQRMISFSFRMRVTQRQTGRLFFSFFVAPFAYCSHRHTPFRFRLLHYMVQYRDKGGGFYVCRYDEHPKHSAPSP